MRPTHQHPTGQQAAVGKLNARPEIWINAAASSGTQIVPIYHTCVNLYVSVTSISHKVQGGAQHESLKSLCRKRMARVY